MARRLVLAELLLLLKDRQEPSMDCLDPTDIVAMMVDGRIVRR
jgi:hypothetical protein